MKPALSWSTAIRIAWRETRASRAKFLFVILAVAIGVGSLTGVRGFSRSFRHMLLREARTLMAGDITARVFALPNAEQEAALHCLHHFVGYPAKKDGIGPREVLGGVAMQVLVRGYCAMIAAPVQCDVDGIPKGSHWQPYHRSMLDEGRYQWFESDAWYPCAKLGNRRELLTSRILKRGNSVYQKST